MTLYEVKNGTDPRKEKKVRRKNGLLLKKRFLTIHRLFSKNKNKMQFVDSVRKCFNIFENVFLGIFFCTAVLYISFICIFFFLSLL